MWRTTTADRGQQFNKYKPERMLRIEGNGDGSAVAHFLSRTC